MSGYQISILNTPNAHTLSVRCPEHQRAVATAAVVYDHTMTPAGERVSKAAAAGRVYVRHHASAAPEAIGKALISKAKRMTA